MNNILTVNFEQSGGFAGMTISVVLNDKMLSQDEYKRVHILVEQADFFELQSDTIGHPHPDQFLYRITVETASQKHTISIFENQVTAELQPLIRFLKGKARAVKR